jgi:hypothetical protein
LREWGRKGTAPLSHPTILKILKIPPKKRGLEGHKV